MEFILFNDLFESFDWSSVLTKKSQKEIQLLNKSILIKKLKDAGIKDNVSISNILAQVKYESSFIPKRENTNYSANRLFELFGKGNKYRNKARFDSLEDAKKAVQKGPEYFFDIIYGNRMGNDKKGDGYKYRGSGLIQLTGKNNFKKMSERLGVDFVQKPDLLLSPKFAYDAVVEYFSWMNKEHLKDFDKVSKHVGFGTGNKNKLSRQRAATKIYQDLESKKLGPVSNLDAAIASLELLPDKKMELYKKKDSQSVPDNTSISISSNDTESESQPIIALDISIDKLKNNGIELIQNLDPNNFSFA